MSRRLFLPPTKAVKIHDAAVRVLENTGVWLDHKEAEALYLNAGAVKDPEGRILIPSNLVNEALEKAKPSFRLYNRDGKNSLSIKNGKTYFGTGPDALYNIDRATQEIVPSTLEHLKENAVLVDALDNIDFIMSMALPQELSAEALYPTVFAEMVEHCRKPIVSTMFSLEDLKIIHNIAKIVAGSENALKKRPFFVAYIEPISPLRMDRGGTDKLLYCAENEIPFLYASGANCGTGAPITPEAGVVQGNAESLAGLVLATLKKESVRFIYGANTSSADMSSIIVCYGSPEWNKTVGMYADIGKYYNLPSWGTGGASDAFFVNGQAAMEAYEGIVLALRTGSTMVHDVGYLAHGELYDSKMLVLTNTMIDRARHLLKKINLSKESLGEEVIDRISRSGDLFLMDEHTFNNFRDAIWIPPSFIERRNIEKQEDAMKFSKLLTAEVDNILSNHSSKGLSSYKLKRIKNLVRGE